MRLLIYGANGFVGREIARLAAQQGLDPVVAGRDADSIVALAGELNVEHRVFGLDRITLDGIGVVLHCAGPYMHTYQPMVDACIAAGVHYLDITGEIPVYQGIASRSEAARARGVMLLPGVGFDVVPTDCLAAHLHRRLPSATHLTLAFHSDGPARLPPGTQRTMIELIPFGDFVRRDAQLVRPKSGLVERTIDFGDGPKVATRLTWGDVFMAYQTTRIPNIEDYAVLPEAMRKQAATVQRMRLLFSMGPVRRLLAKGVRRGPTAEQRAQTLTHVWGEAVDASGRRAVARLHGPEAGVEWTAECALAVIRRVLAGDVNPGFQTPAGAYGADLVLETSTRREDVA